MRINAPGTYFMLTSFKWYELTFKVSEGADGLQAAYDQARAEIRRRMRGLKAAARSGGHVEKVEAEFAGRTSLVLVRRTGGTGCIWDAGYEKPREHVSYLIPHDGKRTLEEFLAQLDALPPSFDTNLLPEGPAERGL